jgi:uncharacterized protein (TIGR03435 family)
MKQAIVAAGLCVITNGAAFAQSATPAPAFEVASVKMAPPPDGMRLRVSLGGDAGRINYENVTIKDVMKEAYQVKDFQIAGPDWFNSVRYNIVAKIPEGSSREQVRRMLQALLAERFQLAFHRETKEVPVYALVVGKNGPKLKLSEAPEAQSNRMMMRMGGGLEARGMSMARFVDMLSRQVSRPVIDMTELKGNYDFTLKYTLDESQRRAMMGGMPVPMVKAEPAAAAPPPDAEGSPSIFAAVQEQLGLKLEARKGPVETLVIDRAEKVPTEN